MTRRVVIISAGTDTRMGGVERFSASLEDALRDDSQITRLSPQHVVPVNIARFGMKDLWQSRDTIHKLDGTQYDLAISNGTLGWGMPKRPPRIHVFHGTMPTSAWCNHGLLRRERLRSAVAGGVAEWLAGRSATTVAVSQSAAEEVWRFYRIRVDSVIENGVDTTLFAPRDKAEARHRLKLSGVDKIALFVGRAEPRKGAAVALHAAGAAGFTLAVAGPRPVGGALHLGLLDPEELSWAYSAADCVVFPTSYEACSFVVLEALACGVPLVTTPVGWARDLGSRVPGYSELLVPPRPIDIVGELQVVRDGQLDWLTRAARDLVARHNSIGSFNAAWRQVADRSTNAGPESTAG